VFFIDQDNRAGAQGDSLEELDKPDGRFQSMLAHMDKRTQYVSFLVRDNSLAAFRKARTIAEQQFFYDTRWQLIGVNEPIKSGASPTAH
jgi:hypothetical protein